MELFYVWLKHLPSYYQDALDKEVVTFERMKQPVTNVKNGLVVDVFHCYV